MITTSSRQLILGSALAVACLSVSAVDALAGGDVHYGSGLARHQAAVPVPAPNPVPDYSSGYYLRLDAAYSMGDVSKYRTTNPHADAIRGDSGLDNFPRYGFGAGYYFSRWLRADITFDQRRDVNSKGAGFRYYTAMNATPVATQMRDTITENLTSGNSTGMINVYADLPMGYRFTPYVGVGIGYARHQVKRHGYMLDTDCIDAVNCDGSPAVTPVYRSNTVGGVDFGLAAALMLGGAFNVNSNMKIDLGYRWLHLQGTTFTGRDKTPGNMHNLTIPDQNIHELRVGLRYDIN